MILKLKVRQVVACKYVILSHRTKGYYKTIRQVYKDAMLHTGSGKQLIMHQ